MALRVHEKCFWPAKIKKKLDLLEMSTFHSPGTHLLFRHKQKKLATASLLFLFFDGFICLGFWKEFFPVFQFLSWSNLVLLLGKRLQMDSKTDLFTNGLIFGFLLGIWLFSLASYLYGLKLAWIAETCFFLMTSSLSKTPLGDTLGYFVNVLVLLAVGFCNIDW